MDLRHWPLVETGHSNTVVRRSPDGAKHAKIAHTPATRAELTAERDRLHWLSQTQIGCPIVLDSHERDGVLTLITATVPGIPACDLSGDAARAAVGAIARFLVDLHALDAAGCPFDHRLAMTERPGSIDDDLRTAWNLAVRLEVADVVVSHGDACLPNLLLEPDGSAVVGVVDVSRLGIADRHRDVALITRSMADQHLNPGFGRGHAEELLGAYPGQVDPWRLVFYRRLDGLL